MNFFTQPAVVMVVTNSGYAFMASGADDEFAEVNKILHHFYGLNNRLLRFIGFGNVWAN